MTGPDLSGIERAVFGDIERKDVDTWLDRHLRARLDTSLTRVLFRSGRIDAVYGAVLDDGRSVAVKVHRNPADATYLTAAVACQQRLLDDGDPGDGHDPGVRRTLARSLCDQVDLLRARTSAALQAGAPAWIRYRRGPWPTPHDPIFDFTTTPPAYAWIVDLARQAAASGAAVHEQRRDPGRGSGLIDVQLVPTSRWSVP